MGKRDSPSCYCSKTVSIGVHPWLELFRLKRRRIRHARGVGYLRARRPVVGGTAATRITVAQANCGGRRVMVAGRFSVCGAVRFIRQRPDQQPHPRADGRAFARETLVVMAVIPVGVATDNAPDDSAHGRPFQGDRAEHAGLSREQCPGGQNRCHQCLHPTSLSTLGFCLYSPAESITAAGFGNPPPRERRDSGEKPRQTRAGV